MWHLDTNIVSNYFRGHSLVEPRVVSKLSEIAVSMFVVAELKFGASKSARPAKASAQVNTFLSSVTIVPFDMGCAEAYCQVRFGLEKKGRLSSDMDMLIASVAIAHGATLVTHNTKHFEAIDGLTLENWLSP